MKYTIPIKSIFCRKRFNVFRFAVLIFPVFVLSTGCATLKPYQMVYVNDPEMQMGSSSTKAFESYAQSIREGSTTPGSKKASGGCGCN